MKRILLSLLLVVCLVTPAFSQSGLINPDQIAGATPQITATAGEDLAAHDIVKIINDGGAKAYKYLTQLNTFGDAFYFLSRESYSARVCTLSANKILLAYSDSVSPYAGRLVVGSINDNTITFGTPIVFLGTWGTVVDVCALSETTAVLVYNDQPNSKVYASLCFIDDTSIETGEAALVRVDSAVYYANVKKLTATKILISYARVSSPYSVNIVGNLINNLTITFGSASDFTGGVNVATSLDMCVVSPSKFVVCYRNSGNSNYGTARVGSIDVNDNITWGDVSVFESASVIYISNAFIADNKFIVCYRDEGNSNYGTARVGSIDESNIITWGDVNVFESNSTNLISLLSLDSSRFIINYMRYYNSRYYGHSKIGVVLNTNIQEYMNEIVFEDASSGYWDSTILDINRFVVFYREAVTKYSSCIIGRLPYSGIILPSYAQNIVTQNNTGLFTILLANNKITNSTLSLSALTPYYLDSNSALTSEVSANYYIGIGLDTTSIFIDGAYPTATAASTIPVSLQRKQ